MIKKSTIILLIFLFIESCNITSIIGLNTEANNSDRYNTEYTRFDDNCRLLETGFIPNEGASSRTDITNGPLGEWPDFLPIGFITAPHPDNPNNQTHLYGDWGGIVGEEFIFLQDGKIKLLYHSYHDTYMTDHPFQEEVLHNWTLGYDPVTKIKYTPLAKPGGSIPGPAWEHTDTPGYIQHPITGEHLIYNTVRPGTKYLHPEWEGLPGWEGAIQVATSDTPPAIGVPFEQTYLNMLTADYWWEQGWNQNGVIKGGLSEPSPVWVPHLGTQGKVRLFYRGLHGSPGSYWNWRISYADSEDGITDWMKNPVPTFDPSDQSNPAYQWTLPWPEGFSFRGSWQAHCTGDVHANGVHMVLMVSNQNYAGFGHIAYYWSPDWGETWVGHPDNPIIAPGQFPEGVPPEGFQRTPTLLIDEEYSRYILAYNAGHDINQSWKRRTYLATASRPQIMSISNVSHGWNFIGAPYNFTQNSSELIIKYGDCYYNWSMATTDLNPTSSPMINSYIFGWNRTIQSYALETKLEPGYGCWLYSYLPCEIWSQYDSLPFDDHITDLNIGWNIISVPYTENVSKSELLVDNANWSDAVTSGWISDFIFGWSRTGQSYNFADTLMSGYAYWMYAYQPSNLMRMT